MSGSTRYSYCDTSIFLSYFNNYENRAKILDVIFEGIQGNNNEKLITSVLTEVEFSWYEENKKPVLDSQSINKIDNFWRDSSLIEIIELNEFTALSARDLMRQARSKNMRPKPLDSIHLVSADYVKASILLTYDKGLFNYANLIGIPIQEPSLNQGRLW